MSTSVHQAYVKKLYELKDQTMLEKHQITWLRSLAWAYTTRDNSHTKMIDDLIETITPLAVAERLLK